MELNNSKENQTISFFKKLVISKDMSAKEIVELKKQLLINEENSLKRSRQYEEFFEMNQEKIRTLETEKSNLLKKLKEINMSTEINDLKNENNSLKLGE